MPRHKLVEISHGDVDIIPGSRSQEVRVVCEGTAVQVALDALALLPTADINRLRIEDIPRLQRSVGRVERNLGLEATMPEAAAPAATN